MNGENPAAVLMRMGNVEEEEKKQVFLKHDNQSGRGSLGRAGGGKRTGPWSCADSMTSGKRRLPARGGVFCAGKT